MRERRQVERDWLTRSTCHVDPTGCRLGLNATLSSERLGAIDLRQWTKTDPAWLVASNQRRCANAPVPAAVRRSRGPDGRIGLAGRAVSEATDRERRARRCVDRV